MRVSSNTANFCTSSASCNSSNRTAFGNTTGKKCFDNAKFYNISDYNGGSLGTFQGLNLNWYFSINSFTSGIVLPTTSTTTWSRIQMAKAAAVNLVTSLTPVAPETTIKVRMGLSSYNQSTSLGGSLLVPISDLNATQATTLTTAVNALSASSPTPLSTTLSDIGRYFTTGYTGTLKLHPNTSSSSDSAINTIFNNQSIDTSHNTSGLSTTVSPIQNYCQKNAVILISDGLPNYDRNVSTVMADYTGDCGTKKVCDATIDTAYNIGFAGPTTATTYTSTPTRTDTGPNSCSTTMDRNGNHISPWTAVCKNGSKTGRAYEEGGSDFLDDVAAALYDMDLRPDLTAAHPTSPKHNLSTYTIGIADPDVKAQVKTTNGGGGGGGNIGTVLEAAAEKGGGTFFFADNYQQLAAALDTMVSSIRKGVGSFSAITANSAQLGVGTALFQAAYDTADWTGDLYAIQLDSSTGNTILPPAWDAGTKIVTPVPAAQTEWQNRNLFTYNTTTKGISFKGATSSVICAKLTTTQLSALGITSCSNTSDTGLWRLDYLRGDISHEVVNTSQTYKIVAQPTVTDPRLVNNTTANRIFRNRVRFRQTNSDIGVTPAYTAGDVWQDPWLLGDIVNSGATYVSKQDYGYGTKTNLSESSSYAAFVTSKNSWRPMLYIGANDGFLHGVDANLTGTGGSEILAYMPNSIFKSGGGLINLSLPTYSHQYFVDGTPRVTDVYFGSAWHTVLVGTTGAGGSGIFALDITDPTGSSTGGTAFGTSDVLWEINSATTPIAADATSLAGNLGYSLPQVSIGRMNNTAGSWAAIVANGYVSTNNKAVLYIINIQTGAIIATLDTLTGSATAANGLSTPFAADVDGNGTIDAVYAGDLLGNMWKFDVSSSDPTQWKVAYKTSAGAPLPLFTACSDGANCDTTRQPITNKPQVGSVGSAQSTGGTMVYFGTGQYFQDTDNNVANTKTQTFYGIWDQCPLVGLPTTFTGSTQSTSPASVCNTTISSPIRTTPANTPAGTLVEQEIVTQQTVSGSNIRGTSSNTINWATQKGWYMDFINPNPDTTVPPNPNGNNQGERIVSASILRDGRIIFSTLIPIPTTTSTTDVCVAGSASTSWVMILDAITGASPSTAALGSSMVTVNGKSVPISGQQTEGGSIGTPTIITSPSGGQLNAGNSSGGIVKLPYNPASASTTGAGRQSWKQL
jgi:type IV pilus assembly protein PilY1